VNVNRFRSTNFGDLARLSGLTYWSATLQVALNSINLWWKPRGWFLKNTCFRFDEPYCHTNVNSVVNSSGVRRLPTFGTWVFAQQFFLFFFFENYWQKFIFMLFSIEFLPKNQFSAKFLHVLLRKMQFSSYKKSKTVCFWKSFKNQFHNPPQVCKRNMLVQGPNKISSFKDCFRWTCSVINCPVFDFQFWGELPCDEQVCGEFHV
jgi:hypothetical protein